MADADFDAVESGTSLDYLVTPDVRTDPKFRGIRIAAPALVDLDGKPDRRGGFARFIIAGSYHLDSNYLGLREDFSDHLAIVAVERRAHRAYIGRLPGIPNKVAAPDPFAGMNLTPADWAGRSVIEFFNLNLVTALGLPYAKGEYVVYAALGRYVSNVVVSRIQ